ncbi:MAG TPA: PTS sugar transporter subunit IIA [Thermoflexia bacterium]|nr:PTS sugar transporter subunit IIA [Thermoflexia bacterium]
MGAQAMSPKSQELWVREELVIVPLQAVSATDAITQLGAKLQAARCVKESWVQATIDREEVFATGLPTKEIGVAIPHTDVVHVLKQAIAVGVLEEPVEFMEMGNPDSTVLVRIVCALAVPRSESMVKVLQRLVKMFQSPETLRAIAGAGSAAKIVEIFGQHLSIKLGGK